MFFGDIAFFVFILHGIRKDKHKNLAYIDGLLKDIEDGKALGSLIELKKMKKA